MIRLRLPWWSRRCHKVLGGELLERARRIVDIQDPRCGRRAYHGGQHWTTEPDGRPQFGWYTQDPLEVL